jgi:hypothetical protein
MNKLKLTLKDGTIIEVPAMPNAVFNLQRYEAMRAALKVKTASK